MFKDLKAGDKVYIINNTDDDVSVCESIVKSITQPHTDIFSTIPNQMVVDLSIEEDGQTKIYSIPEALSVTYTKYKIIVSDTSELIKETEQIRLGLSEDLDPKTIERKRKKMNATKDVLSHYSPYFQREASMDTRVSSLEDGMAYLKESMQTIIEKLNK